HWSLVIGHWSLVIGHWSLVIGHWSLVIGHWSLVIGHWSLVIGHWSGLEACLQNQHGHSVFFCPTTDIVTAIAVKTHLMVETLHATSLPLLSFLKKVLGTL
ncbi:MAG: hypothetical protein RIG27_27390, partial [Coleofasciculus sp. F4-SAH-05]